jgi:NitT/TauT family transport system substrate-binding protein
MSVTSLSERYLAGTVTECFAYGHISGACSREATMNIPSFRIMPVTASVVMLLVAGCASGSVGSGSGSGSSSASASARPDPELADITVAALPAADLAGLYIAQDEGLFARQGLHVTIAPVASSQAVITAQLKGQVDIGAGSYIPYISAQAAGAKFRVLAEASTLHPDTRVLVTTENSPIVTVGQLVGRQIGVNGTNSIGTLLISVLLSDRGISPAKVRFVTDAEGFPAMPAELQAGAWSAAFLAEPYVTYAGEKYGERILADLDQGSALNFPIDGYVATAAWAQKYPKTAAAFVRAIQAAQLIADTNPTAVQAAIAKYDDLGPMVTTAMALSGYPTGPVNKAPLQRVALAMLEFGMLGPQDAAEVQQGTLTGSMIPPAS